MTQHVRTSYRKHPKAAWGLALALAVAIGAIVIPIATGAPEKTYTMLFPSSGAVTPAPPTTGNGTGLQNLCTSSSYTVKIEIKNTAKTASLGSGNITFPAGLTLTGAAIVSGAPAGTAEVSGSVVSLRQLSLPKGNTVTFSVALNTGSSSSAAAALSAVIKQSNDFSDSGTNPDANTFSPPSTFPQLAVQDCSATISGKVFLDRNDNGSFGTGTGSTPSDVPKQGWSVALLKKTGATTYTQIASTTTDANGDYSFTAQQGSDYKVCVAASSADAGSAWGLIAPTGSDCGPISATSDSTSGGRLITNLPASGATGQNFAVVPVTALFGASDTASTSGDDSDYSVTAGSGTTKSDRRYVQQTWTESGGDVFFVFSPLTACTGIGCNDKLYLLETVSGEIDQSALSGPQVTLKYDDDPPYDTFVDMPYCVNDPRGASPDDIATTGILPSDAKSCIVTGNQEIIGGSTPKVSFEFLVYTIVDGGRGVG